MTNFSSQIHDTINTVRSDFFSPTARKNLPEMLKSLNDARAKALSDEVADAIGQNAAKALANSAVDAYNEISRKMLAGKHAAPFRACLAKFDLPETLVKV